MFHTLPHKQPSPFSPNRANHAPDELEHKQPSPFSPNRANHAPDELEQAYNHRAFDVTCDIGASNILNFDDATGYCIDAIEWIPQGYTVRGGYTDGRHFPFEYRD